MRSLRTSNRCASVLGIFSVVVLAIVTAPRVAATGEPPPSEKKSDTPTAPKTFRILARTTDGKPIPGVRIYASLMTHDPSAKTPYEVKNTEVKTDDHGAVVIDVPKHLISIRTWASKDGYAQLFANWETQELTKGSGLPAEYTFVMEKSVVIGGRVVNEHGLPIAGAKLHVNLSAPSRPAQHDQRVSYSGTLAHEKSPALTDIDGRWKLDGAPDRSGLEFNLLISHPDYLNDGKWIRTDRDKSVTARQLREGSAVVTLKNGVIVRGRVTDPAGRPIKDAVVIYGDDPYISWTSSKFLTDAEGRYRLPALQPQPTNVTVLAPGFAPQLRKVDLTQGPSEQDFRMVKGRPTKVKFVDEAGKPVPNVRVYLKEWMGIKSIQTDNNPNHAKVPDVGIPLRSDQNGIWTWENAPYESVNAMTGRQPGFINQTFEFAGGSAPLTIVLKAEHRITGKVVDAETGEPIPLFTVVPVTILNKWSSIAERYNATQGSDGRLDVVAHPKEYAQRIRIEAPGYRTQDGPIFTAGDDSPRVQDFRLISSPPRTGVLVDVAGKPVVGAIVQMVTRTESIRSSIGPLNSTQTDAEGRFQFADPGEAYKVVVESASGYATVDGTPDQADLGTLKLLPWATVQGKFQDDGKPIAGATVILSPVRYELPGSPRMKDDQITTTKPDGSFFFDRVPPIPMSIRIGIGPWQEEVFRSGPAVPLDMKPGEAVNLSLGSEGAVIHGQVKLKGNVPADLDCVYSLNHLIRREAGIAPPPELASAPIDPRKGWSVAWKRTAEGSTFLQTRKSWFVKLAADGSFRISGVPVGEYDLLVEVYAKPTGCLVNPLARRVVPVTVTPEDERKGTMTLPDVPVEVVVVPELGNVAMLTYRTPDGRKHTLADQNGKYRVVHFWASWCVPCKKQIPELKELQRTFAEQDVAMISVSLDDEDDAWTIALKGMNLPWPQGRIEAIELSGISGAPKYWLLDPKGKIIAIGYDPADIDEAIKKNKR